MYTIFQSAYEHSVSDDARTSHELEHARQFENGELTFNGTKPDPMFYDETDEEKAFQMQNMITNTEVKPGEDYKDDVDAKKRASDYELHKEDLRLSNKQKEQIKSSTSGDSRRKNRFNYKPTEKQKNEKKSVL